MDKLDKYIKLLKEWFLKSDLVDIDKKLKDEKWLSGFLDARKLALENQEREEFEKMDKKDKLATLLEEIDGATLYDASPNFPPNSELENLDFVELKVFTKYEIDAAKEAIEKCGFEVVEEMDDEWASDYYAYLIFIKEKEDK